MAVQDTVYVTYIRTTPEKLWEALTKGEFTKKYFFGRRVESDWKKGSTVSYYMEDGAIDVQGTILEIDPPHIVTFTWRVVRLEEYMHLPDAIVTYRIDDLDGLVKLTMIEAHPEPIEEKYLEAGRFGWPIIMSGLKTLMETGEPLPPFDPMKAAPEGLFDEEDEKKPA